MDAELLNVYPHMHLRGKSMVLSAVYPTGEREEFVRVPHYDFNWQLVYALSQPRILPKGTLLKADATFDNSANNRTNPNPKAAVRWGDQSWDEMMVGFFDLAIPDYDRPGERSSDAVASPTPRRTSRPTPRPALTQALQRP